MTMKNLRPNSSTYDHLSMTLHSEISNRKNMINANNSPMLPTNDINKWAGYPITFENLVYL